MKLNAPEDIAELGEFLRYEPETGHLYWLKRPGRFTSKAKPGQVAGAKNAGGYMVINFRRRMFYCHRIAWALVHGTWPVSQIDHIDGDKANNRIANLRLCNHRQNACNSVKRPGASGTVGVTQVKQTGRWKAQVSENGKHRFIGTYASKHEAAAAYWSAKEQIAGEFFRKDKPCA